MIGFEVKCKVIKLRIEFFIPNNINRFFGICFYKIISLKIYFRTALAEAELEYNEAHKSPSLYLQIEIKDIPKIQYLKGKW